jgi:hypothetical protein
VGQHEELDSLARRRQRAPATASGSAGSTARRWPGRARRRSAINWERQRAARAATPADAARTAPAWRVCARAQHEATARHQRRAWCDEYDTLGNLGLGDCLCNLQAKQHYEARRAGGHSKVGTQRTCGAHCLSGRKHIAFPFVQPVRTTEPTRQMPRIASSTARKIVQQVDTTKQRPKLVDAEISHSRQTPLRNTAEHIDARTTRSLTDEETAVQKRVGRHSALLQWRRRPLP